MQVPALFGRNDPVQKKGILIVVDYETLYSVHSVALYKLRRTIPTSDNRSDENTFYLTLLQNL